MTTMTRAQRETSNADSFRRKFGILHKAGVGVVLCRSHEPTRVIEALRDFAMGEADHAFKHWTVLGGWHSVDRSNPSEVPDNDNNVDLLSALRGVSEFGNGIYVVMYPHPWLKDNKVPPLTQLIKDYANLLTETKKRVVLLCPPGVSLPIELQQDVTILDFELPSFAELNEVYKRTAGALPKPKQPNYSPDMIDRIISAGAGMTGHEFETAVSRAFVSHRELLPAIPIDVTAAAVLEVKVEAVKRTNVLEVMPVGNMDEVGGLGNLKRWITQRRACFGQEAQDFGIDALKGILLAGPPGTGKSLVSKAIAHVMGLPLIKFDVSRAFGSLVGQSEAQVDEALRMAEAMSPCVLFLDEIDKALGGSADGGGDSGVTKRVLGKILTWLQENDKPIFCVFSANRVEQLPSELIRKGRLDEIWSVSIPNDAERRDILSIHLRKRKEDPTQIDLDEAVRVSEGYVPAELEAAVKEAKVIAFNTEERRVTGDMIVRQLQLMTPLSKAFEEQFAAMRTWAEKNARPANGDEKTEESRVQARPRPRTRTATPGRVMEVG